MDTKKVPKLDKNDYQVIKERGLLMAIQTTYYCRVRRVACGLEELAPGFKLTSELRVLWKANWNSHRNSTWNEDQEDAKYAIRLFIDSEVAESEKRLMTFYGKSLMHTHALGVLSMLKALMTMDEKDIEMAMNALRNTAEATNYLKKEQQGLLSAFTGLIFGTGQKSKIAQLKGMTFFEKQVELVNAESYLLKALLSILTDSNFTTLIKEGINIKNSFQTEKSCYKYLYKIHKQGGEDALIENGIDQTFITGTYLGMGGFNLLLSILPQKVLRIFEFMGFSGNREFGLQCLSLGGGWPAPADNPIKKRKKQVKVKSAINFFSEKIPQESGLGSRKFICETMLHLYYDVISTLIPVPVCNIPLAAKMTDKILQDHPKSFLFLLVRAKVSQSERRINKAIEELNKVISAQKDWRQLAHICFWELGICHGAIGEYSKAAEYFDTLCKENEWSKAIYYYIKGALLYEDDPIKNKAEIEESFRKVPENLKKIAGKSIPLEKFVARKARKYFLQEGRLLFPFLEMLYMWNGFDLIPEPRLKLIVDDLEKELSRLDKLQEDGKAEGKEIPYSSFYDDLCLIRFFKGLATRELAYPSALLLVPEREICQRVVSAEQTKGLEYAARQLEYISLQADEIEFDHWILPFARYELAGLYLRKGDYVKSRQEYQAALNGGYAEDEAGKQKKKPSMETTLHIKIHNALQKLNYIQSTASDESGNESGSNYDHFSDANTPDHFSDANTPDLDHAESVNFNESCDELSG